MKQQIQLLLFAIKLHFGGESLGVIFLCANRTKGLCILSFNTYVHATANEPLNVSKFSKINTLFTLLNKVPGLEVEIKRSAVKGTYAYDTETAQAGFSHSSSSSYFAKSIFIMCQ